MTNCLIINKYIILQDYHLKLEFFLNSRLIINFGTNELIQINNKDHLTIEQHRRKFNFLFLIFFDTD